MDKIQMTEEQAKEICILWGFEGQYDIDGKIKQLKQAGYIKEDIVEEVKDIDKIQLTEEQARDMYNGIKLLCSNDNCKQWDKCIECHILNLKQAGYIKKDIVEDIVEQAEEIYKKYCAGFYTDTFSLKIELIEMQHDAIKYLKAKLDGK